jgi:hypothetical protein
VTRFNRGRPLEQPSMELPLRHTGCRATARISRWDSHGAVSRAANGPKHDSEFGIITKLWCQQVRFVSSPAWRRPQCLNFSAVRLLTGSVFSISRLSQGDAQNDAAVYYTARLVIHIRQTGLCFARLIIILRRHQLIGRGNRRPWALTGLPGAPRR